MNCPNCHTLMIASPTFGERVTVTHTCPNCQHRHVVTFDKPENEFNPFAAPKKPIIRTGQVFTMRFMNETSYHWVIAQETSRLGRQLYILHTWNSHANRFMTVSEDDYMYKQGGFSNADYAMPESVKAAARAYRLSKILGKLNKRLRRVSSGLVECSKIIAQSSYRQKFDIEDKTGFSFLPDEPDFLFGNPKIKAETIALQKTLAARWYEEMKLAGIEI